MLTKTFNTLKAIQSAIHKAEDLILIALLMIMTGLAMAQIILRNGFDSGMPWAENALRVLVLWVALFGAMRASRTSGHIAIDLVQRYWKGKLAELFQALVLLISAAICAIAAYYSYQYVLIEKEDGLIAFLSVPVWVCESIIPAALALLALRFVLEALGLCCQSELAEHPDSTKTIPYDNTL
jgi:TRAP-type C4-dicarboxylate transport system permease small subunit